MAGAGFLGAKFAGFTGALLSSLFVASLVGGIYGLERIRGLFSTESPDGIRPWWEPSLKMGLMLVPLVALSGIIFHEQSALFRLVGAGLMVGGGSAFLLFKIGLSESFRTEIANRFRRRSG